MQRKFLLNIILLLGVNLLIKPFWILGIDRTVQNMVGAENYGFYYALFNFSFLFNIFLDFGITNFNNRNIAQSNQLISKHFSNIVTLKLILAVVYTLITFGVGVTVGYDKFRLKLLLFLIANQFLSSFILYLRSNITGLHLFKTDSLMSILDRLIMILICSIVIWGGIFKIEISIEWFIKTQFISYLMVVIIGSIIVAFQSGKLKLKFDFTFSLMILKQSFPFAILFLLMVFYNRSDAVMLDLLLKDGAYQAGVYAQGYRLLDSVNMLAYLFATLLLPMFSKMLKERQNVTDLVVLCTRLLLAGSIIISLLCYFFGQPIIEMLYTQVDKNSVPTFILLMFCFIPISITYVIGTLLTANSNMKYLNQTAFFGMLLNIILNLIFIPKYLSVGAACASLITQIITILIQLFIAKKVFNFNFNWKLIGTTVLFFGGMVFIGNYITLIKFDWKITAIIYTIIGFLMAFVLKLINIKNIYQTLKIKVD